MKSVVVSVGDLESIDERPPKPFESSEPRHVDLAREKRTSPFTQSVNAFLPGFVPPKRETLDPLGLVSKPFLFPSDPAYVKARKAFDALLARREELIDSRDSEELIDAKKAYDGSDESYNRMRQARIDNDAQRERNKLDAERMDAEIRAAANVEIEARISVLKRKASEIKTPKAEALTKASSKLAEAMSEIEGLLTEATAEQRQVTDSARRITTALLGLGEQAPPMPAGVDQFYESLGGTLKKNPYLREELRHSLPPISKVPKAFWSKRRRQ